MNAATGASGNRLLNYTHSRLVAVIDTPADLAAAAESLTANGFAGLFDLFQGPADARRIDFAGTVHGPLARMSYVMHHTTEEGDLMDRYEQELFAGRCLIVVRTKGPERRQTALDILKAHHGRFINQFAWWAVETVHP